MRLEVLRNILINHSYLIKGRCSMKFMKAVVSSLVVAGAFSLTGCMTTTQVDEAKVESDAAIAAAQAETEAAKAEAAAMMAQVEAEVAEIQAKLDEAMSDVANQVQASREIPGSTLTENGTLLFKAEGQSVAKAGDGAEGLAKARMAAETIAKANLLEVIKGGLITSSITVSEMMFESQMVSSQVSGWLGGAVLATETSEEEKSNLPDAEVIDQIVTSTASLEISIDAWEDLQDYVE
jgi:hypothetical protein